MLINIANRMKRKILSNNSNKAAVKESFFSETLKKRTRKNEKKRLLKYLMISSFIKWKN